MDQIAKPLERETTLLACFAVLTCIAACHRQPADSADTTSQLQAVEASNRQLEARVQELEARLKEAPPMPAADTAGVRDVRNSAANPTRSSVKPRSSLKQLGAEQAELENQMRQQGDLQRTIQQMDENTRRMQELDTTMRNLQQYQK